jgi:hypothetical protein
MRKLLILLLLPVVLLSCNRSGMGIFYSISEEQPLADTDLDNTLSVTGFAEAGTQYVMSAGTLFSRSMTESVWTNTVDMPTGLTVCVSLVTFSSDLYAVFADVTGVTTGLYTSPTGTVAWTEISVTDNRLTALTATTTALYLTEMVDSATYITRESQDGADFSTTLTLDGQYTSVTDSATFAASAWLLSGTNIYKGSPGLPASYVNLASTPETVAGYGGLMASSLVSPPALFVSNAEGTVYASSDGINWGSATIVDSDDNPVPLFDMAEISVAGTPVVLVGAEDGYYDIVFEGGAFITTFTPVTPGSEAAGSYSSSDSNYLVVDLRRSVVRFFYVDVAESTIFAGTSGNGLWINPISGSDPDTVVRKWDRQ